MDTLKIDSYLHSLLLQHKFCLKDKQKDWSRPKILIPQITKLLPANLHNLCLRLNKINVNIHNSTSCNVFKRVILKFIRPEPNEVFNVESSEGLKFLARIRLGLSLLADHKFRHNFQDWWNTALIFSNKNRIYRKKNLSIICIFLKECSG